MLYPDHLEKPVVLGALRRYSVNSFWRLLLLLCALLISWRPDVQATHPRSQVPSHRLPKTVEYCCVVAAEPKEEEVAATICVLLEGKDKALRLKAIATLASVGAKDRVIAALMSVLKRERDSELTYAAALTLEGFGPAAKPAIPDLVELTSRGPRTWPGVVVFPGGKFRTPFDLLHSIGHPAAVPLIETMKDKDNFRRYHAACTLSAILAGKPIAWQDRELLMREAIPDQDMAGDALRAALSDTTEDVQLAAAITLNQLEPKNQLTVPVLRKLAQSKTQTVSDTAVRELVRLGVPASPDK
jgi:HEAT repeat protein